MGNRVAKFRTKNSHSTSFVDTISNAEILDLADATIELAKETCLDKYEIMSVQLKDQFKRHRQINQEITPVEDHVFYEEEEFDLENEGPEEETTSTTTSSNYALQNQNQGYQSPHLNIQQQQLQWGSMRKRKRNEDSFFTDFWITAYYFHIFF